MTETVDTYLALNGEFALLSVQKLTHLWYHGDMSLRQLLAFAILEQLVDGGVQLERQGGSGLEGVKGLLRVRSSEGVHHSAQCVRDAAALHYSHRV